MSFFSCRKDSALCRWRVLTAPAQPAPAAAAAQVQQPGGVVENLPEAFVPLFVRVPVSISRAGAELDQVTKVQALGQSRSKLFFAGLKSFRPRSWSSLGSRSRCFCRRVCKSVGEAGRLPTRWESPGSLTLSRTYMCR